MLHCKEMVTRQDVDGPVPLCFGKWTGPVNSGCHFCALQNERRGPSVQLPNIYSKNMQNGMS